MDKPYRERRNEKGLQEVHFDFMILGDQGDPGGTRACILARELDARMTLATMLPSKSGGISWWAGFLRFCPIMEFRVGMSL